MKKYTLYPILFTFIFTLTACSSGDGIPESTTSLTASQQEAVAEVLNVGATSPVAGSINGLSVSEDYTETVDCDVSGSYTLKGNITYTINEQIAEFNGKTNFKQTFNDCELLTSENEQLILNGTVTSKTTFDTDAQAETLFGSLNNTVTGGLDVSGADVEEGVCGIDVQMEITANASSTTVNYVGQICGSSFSQTVTMP